MSWRRAQTVISSSAPSLCALVADCKECVYKSTGKPSSICVPFNKSKRSHARLAKCFAVVACRYSSDPNSNSAGVIAASVVDLTKSGGIYCFSSTTQSASADGKDTLEVGGGDDVWSDEKARKWLPTLRRAPSARDNWATAAGKILCWTETNMVHNIPQRAGEYRCAYVALQGH